MDELDRYLLELGMADSVVVPGTGAAGVLAGNGAGPAADVPIPTERMDELAAEYLSVSGIRARVERILFPDVVDALGRMPQLTNEDMGDVAALGEWFSGLERELGEAPTPYRVEFERNGADSFTALVYARVHSVEVVRELSSEFFRSSDYRTLVRMSRDLLAPLGLDANVKRGDRSKQVPDLKSAFDWLTSEARRGLSIQRYKGLGEMNPDQLWETTMDPARRRLVRIRVEDAVAADDLFSTLMGDQVEPRRDFIESNALSVANIDA